MPRVRCPERGVPQVALGWARPGSGFTLLFEALVMAMVKEMPVGAVASLSGEHDTRVWRVVHHYVDEARAAQDLSKVERVGVDETSFRRGQHYVSVFADLDRPRAVFVTEGRKAEVFGRFVDDLAAHGGAAKQITEVCQDMSEAYLAGALEHLPESEITFDRYHVKAQLTKAVDEVRRSEAKEQQELLRRSRYSVASQPQQSHRPPARAPRRAAGPSRFGPPAPTAGCSSSTPSTNLEAEAAEHYLRRWVRGAKRSRLKPIIGFAQMVEEYWLGILRWFHSKVSNGLLEGLNSLIQAAKRRARGYRSTRNYIAMIHLVAGKLDFSATQAK